jgi:hypothetical protein
MGPVEESAFFKPRLPLSGELRSKRGAAIARGPAALLDISPGESREGYFIAGAQPVRMVVLHCRPGLLTELPRLCPTDVPPPMMHFFLGLANARVSEFHLRPKSHARTNALSTHATS